jgi:DNA topoisomerase-1
MDVVVVESPAKAKTIEKYLGAGYKVLASYGHVRDLPAKDGSVDPDGDFAMIWQVADKSEKHLSAIARALKGAERLYLATDPDREGEAISWHVREVLKDRNALEGVDVKRVVFHEVTKGAVLDALQNPRELDHGLIDAYLARRALDYLVGFNLSPVLWRKLPGSRSAGRVQSVALRLIAERESEIEVFKAREYWTIEALFRTAGDASLTARLTHLDGEKLGNFGIGDEAAATAATAAVRAASFRVATIERKTVRRNPQPPFTTSTLQQEASRKLGFSASRTMRVAQKLYEGLDIGGETVGLITYMRTDSVNMAQEAVTACRALIGRIWGPDYVPPTPNTYRTKARNAQEAHEAIRPTDVSGRPKDLAPYLDDDGRRLYELIWNRTVASAMQPATLEQVAIDITSSDRAITLRATGSVVLFDGFRRLYQEGRDDPNGDDEKGDRILPKVAENEPMATGEVTPEQHFTKPPPRYSEASLVRKLEELGIGRPSTYASIISVLQDRNYVRLDKRRFIPEDRGRVVTAFLAGYFNRYVQYNFTADLEDKLDSIANREIKWKGVLRDFWPAFWKSVQETRELRITDVINTLDADLAPHFFPVGEDGADPRICRVCGNGRLGLKLGRSGPFIGCANYPDCTYTRSLAVNGEADDTAIAVPRDLGSDPGTDEIITLRKGPYGFYIQRGEAKGKEKPRRATVLKGIDPATLTLETALVLLSLPREVGIQPETGDMILAGMGRFGPYLKVGTEYTSLGEDDDILTIGLNRAVAVIREKPKHKRAEPLRELGAHPDDGKPVNIFKGRYGPYVKHGRINASLPKSVSEDELTLAAAVTLIAERAAKTGKGGGRAKGGRAKGTGGAKKRTPRKAKTQPRQPADA